MAANKLLRDPTTKKLIRNRDTKKLRRDDGTCPNCCEAICNCNCQDTNNGPRTPIDVPCCLALHVTGHTSCGCVHRDLGCPPLGSPVPCSGNVIINAVDIDITLAKMSQASNSILCHWQGATTIEGLGEVYPAAFDEDDLPICGTPCGEIVQVQADYYYNGRNKKQYLVVRAWARISYNAAAECPGGATSSCIFDFIIFRQGDPFGGFFIDGDTSNDVCVTHEWPDPITLTSQLTSTADPSDYEAWHNHCGTHDVSGYPACHPFCEYETVACHGGTATLTVAAPGCLRWDGFIVTPELDDECLPGDNCSSSNCCYQAYLLEHIEGGGCTELGATGIWTSTASCDLEDVVWHFPDQTSEFRRCFVWHATDTPFGTLIDAATDTVVVGDCDDEQCIPIPPTACKCWHHWKATYTLGPCVVSMEYVGTECSPASAHARGEWVDTEGECARDYWDYLDDCASDPCTGECDGTQPSDPTPPSTPPRDQCPDCGTCDCFDCCVGDATATISGTGWCRPPEEGGFCLDGVHATLVKQSTCFWSNLASAPGEGFVITVRKLTSGPNIGKWQARAFDGSGCEIVWLLNSTACCPFHASTAWGAGTIIDASGTFCPEGIAGGTFSWSC